MRCCRRPWATTSATSCRACRPSQFIETRQQVQEQAAGPHPRAAHAYEVETRGVYIQDVVLPEELVQVLTQREIANQQKATYQMQQEAQQLRIDLEKTKGTADMQAQLAQAPVGVEIATDRGGPQESGRRRGDLHRRDRPGQGSGSRGGRPGPPRASRPRSRASGQGPTAIINVTTALAERGSRSCRRSWRGGGGTFDGVGATLMKYLVPPPAIEKAKEASSRRRRERVRPRSGSE